MALDEADPAEDERGRQILHEERDTDGDTGDRGEIEGLHTRDGEQPEPEQQERPAAYEIPVPPGDGQHDEGGARHP